MPEPATPPVVAPVSIAQLRHVPDSLAAFIAVGFPPFGRPRRKPGGPVAAHESISWRIMCVIQYRGSEGTLLVSTVRPSPAALARELDLGVPVGQLPDGTTIYSMVGVDNLGYQVRWLKGGIIVALTGNMSVARLVELAADIDWD